MKKTKSGKTKDTSVVEFVNKLGNSAKEFSALYFFMTKLENYKSKLLQRKKVVSFFNQLVSAKGGAVFSLYNDDLVVIFDKKDIDEVRGSIIKARYIFNDDPLIQSDLRKGDSSDTFVKIYDLANSIPEFQRLVKTGMNEYFEHAKMVAPKTSMSSKVVSNKKQTFNKMEKNKITPDTLYRIQNILSKTDFSNIIRRMPVCIIIGTAKPQMLYDEVSVAINDLQEIVAPGVDIKSNMWLFRELTEVLDRRVLITVKQHDDGALNNNFSINLNVKTVLSDDFLDFDDHFMKSAKATITVEFNILDVMSDIKAFILAQAFLRYRGYKTCIDGIGYDKAPYLNYKELPSDLFKIIWSPALEDLLNRDNFFASFDDSLMSRVIISDIDTKAALSSAQKLGGNLFQGKYVQKLLFEKKRIV